MKNYGEMTIEELQAKAKEIEADAVKEYKAFAKCDKYALLTRAKAAQRVNSLTEKSSKDEIIRVILTGSHYDPIRRIEKTIKARQ